MIKSIGLLGCVLSTVLYAAENPVSQGYDSRIKQVEYNPANVVNVYTKVGRATLIQLQKGETVMSKRLSGIGMGDANAWNLMPRGNNIFIKPVAKNPDTNLIIVSDKGRTYSFDLKTVWRDARVSYIVKLTYPHPNTASSESPPPCTDGRINFSYFQWGDKSLSPEYAWDDGRFTCFKFAHNVAIPVVYQITAGKEALVNFHMDRDVMVVHSVANTFRLRLGNAVLGVKTDHLHPQGYNAKGSSMAARREVIHG